MKAKSLNPKPEHLRAGILKTLCKETGKTHNEILKENGIPSLCHYLYVQKFNTLLWYKISGAYKNGVKMSVNKLRV